MILLSPLVGTVEKQNYRALISGTINLDPLTTECLVKRLCSVSKYWLAEENHDWKLYPRQPKLHECVRWRTAIAHFFVMNPVQIEWFPVWLSMFIYLFGIVHFAYSFFLAIRVENCKPNFWLICPASSKTGGLWLWFQKSLDSRKQKIDLLSRAQQTMGKGVFVQIRSNSNTIVSHLSFASKCCTK